MGLLFWAPANTPQLPPLFLLRLCSPVTSCLLSGEGEAQVKLQLTGEVIWGLGFRRKVRAFDANFSGSKWIQMTLGNSPRRCSRLWEEPGMERGFEPGIPSVGVAEGMAESWSPSVFCLFDFF